MNQTRRSLLRCGGMLPILLLTATALAGPDGPPRIVSIDPAPTGGADQLGVPAIHVGFDEAITVPAGAIRLDGFDAGPLEVTSEFDFGTNVLTITLPGTITADVLTLVLDFTITDMTGLALDGEIFDPSTGALPSGDGRAGGQAVFQWEVLQGDANRDGTVDSSDAQLVAQQLGLCAGDPGFDSLVDLNADGCVNVLEVAIIQNGFGGVRPVTDGQGPTITSRDPAASASIRAFSFETVVVEFDEPVDPARIDERSLFSSQPNGVPRAADLLELNGTTATFTFAPPLEQSGIHRIQLSNAVGDSTGELLDTEADRSWYVELDQRPAHIVGSSPQHGESDVALTRETVITFDHPLDAEVFDESAVFATFAGETLDVLVHLNAAADTVTLFYAQPLPASAEIRVTVVGDLLVDDLGNAVDPEYDNVAGGTRLIDFQTLTLTTLPGTRVCGRVFDSVLSDDGVNVPLEGVLVSVDGAADELFAVTDAKGDFCLDPAPVGTFFVHIDGRTAQNTGTPEGAYYPNVGKPWTSIAGQEVNVGNVFLPLVIDGTLQPVSDVSDTTIEFPAAVIEDNPQLEGVQITVPAGSLFANDGTIGGAVGMAPVDPARLPGQLPPGLEFPLVITVQSAPGAEDDMQPTNFDTPAPVVFPNLPDPVTGLVAPPGAERALFSFNHDAGRWEAVGTMTVSQDGAFAVADPGSGILAPGWHGTGPPPIGPPPPPCGGSCCGGAPVDPSAAGGCGCNQDACDECFEICGTDFALCNIATVTKFFACANRCEPGFLFTFDDCVQLCTGVREAMESSCNESSAFCFVFGCPSCTGCPNEAGGGTAGPSGDETLNELSVLASQMAALVYPFIVSGEPVPPDTISQFYDLFDQANALTDGSVVDYLTAAALALETELAPQEAEIGEAEGNAPPYAIHYLAEIPRDNGEILRLRGMTGPDGQYSIFVPSDGTVAHVLFYDHVEDTWGHADQRLTPEATYRLRRLSAHPVDTFPDFDDDGLADVVEWTLGTDTFNPDTDGDGIPDGAEVDQGTNPLDGLIVQTGIIATADTPGTAVDICAINDLAIVADREGGVSVFNVFNGMDPTIIAQVQTTSDVQAVSCTADGRFVGALTADGLTIIDMTDPPAAFIAHEVSPAHLLGAPTAIVAAGDTFYVGSELGAVAVVDAATGSVLDHVLVGSAIHDLAVDGEMLYALRGTSLSTIPLFGQPLSVLASESVPGQAASLVDRRRLTVGDGVAYAVWGQGVATVDVSNPANPTLIAEGGSTQFGWKQVAINGSGDAVAAVGPNGNGDPPNHVSLYDFSDPANTDVFVTQFTTPGTARSVSIYNGLAYVADSQSGLHVVNYEPYDALGIAPTVSFTTNVGGSEVVEGSLILVSVSVDDDVQVRNVELIVNDETVQTDGNFPFQFYVNAPLLDGPAGAGAMTITVRASDTGGNTALALLEELTIIPDTTAPTVIATNPESGASVPEVLIGTVGLSLRFSESLDPATVDGASVLVIAAGRDGELGTQDDAIIPASVSLVELDRRLAVVPDTAPIGPMRLFVDGSIVTDAAGNFIDGDADGTGGDDFMLDFESSDSPFTKTWITEVSGEWGNPDNWSGGTVPDATDIVLIDQPTLVVVTVSGGSFQVGAVHCVDRMDFQSGGLTVLDTLQVDDELTFNGGTLSGATLLPSALGIPTRVTSGTFAGVTIEGTVEVTQSLLTSGGLTINGTLDIQGASVRTLSGQTLDGTGLILGTGNSASLRSTGGLSTLVSTLTVRCEANFNMDINGFSGGSWINHATLLSPTASLRCMDEFTNHGLISCEGGDVELRGQWVNNGTILLSDGTLKLGGSFTPAAIGDLQRTGGTVVVIGAMDNTGETLLLDATTGTWELAHISGSIGNIIGGVIDTADGSVLRVIGGTGRLTGVTIEGLVEVPGILEIAGGLTINGTVEIQDGFMATQSGQTIDGTGVIRGTGNAPVVLAEAGVSTLGPNLTVICEANSNMNLDGFAGGSWVNQATLQSLSGDLLCLDEFTNEGLISCTGGDVSLRGDWINSGTIELSAGTLKLGGTFTTADIGDIQRKGGTVQINGTMDNTGDTLLLDAATGTWELTNSSSNPGNIIGGAIETADGSVLRVVGQARMTSATVAGAVEVPGQLTIINGVTINGTVALQNGFLNALNGVLVDGTGTVTGTGSAPRMTARAGVSTLGPSLTVICDASGNMIIDEFDGGAWINQATITAVSGTLRFDDPWTNEGTLIATTSSEVNTAAIETTNAGILRVEPGGTMTIHTLTQTAAGSIELDVAGTSPAQYGSVAVTNTATLDGSLVLRFVDRFTPTAGNSFDAMTWAGFAGAFADVSGVDLPAGLDLDPLYDAAGLSVGIVRSGAD